MLYSLVAVAVGLVLILAPLQLKLAPSTCPSIYVVGETNYQHSMQPDRIDSNRKFVFATEHPSGFLEVLSVSFFAALVMYAVFRRREPREHYRAPPYLY